MTVQITHAPTTHHAVPRLPRGMRDLDPKRSAARQSMIDTIRRVYEL
jgi:hypothetical protein